MSTSRFPRSVYSRGTEPDARFSLANERTFLAWISVGLALISVGVGLESLALNLQPGYRLAASVLLVLGGIGCPVQAWFGWRQVETALREGRPLPFTPMLVGLPVLLAATGVLVVLALATR
ncbi:YidH family protein [Propionicimonas sp.]|uniref:YidH family protein n=1 Tax=Propionicimonas sp. TaxID=1955623 RepID=UPI0039E55868